MSKFFALWVALFFIAGCGSLPVEKNADQLPILAALPIVRVPLEIPYDISPVENPWVDLSVEINSNFRLINTKYVNSSHPHSNTLKNNAFKAAKYWGFSPKDVGYAEGKRYILRIENIKHEQRYNPASKIKKPRSAGSIMKTILNNKNYIQSVFRQNKTSATHYGLMAVELTIEKEGHISNCRIVQSRLYNKELDLKILNAIKTIDFGFEESDPTVILQTFEFSPQS